MPKLKTRKAVAKRYNKKASGKTIKRSAGQNHFNSRESGKVGRNKKSDKVAHYTHRKVLQINLPHN